MSQFDDSNATLIEHLTELRKRMVWALGFVAIGFFGCWFFSEIIFDIVRQPITEHLEDGGLVFTAPMDKFMAHIKVSFLGGILMTSPFWMHQIWLFIAPGLYDNEKKHGVAFIFFGTILFVSGVSFVYFVVYPAAFEFLLNFGGGTDKPMITIGEYLSFFTTTTLVFGLAFEMPLILSILGMMGFVTPEFLSSKRRYAIVILAALSAIFTPPDVISMVLMMIPMLGLYELSIVMVRILGKKNPPPEEF